MLSHLARSHKKGDGHSKLKLVREHKEINFHFTDSRVMLYLVSKLAPVPRKLEKLLSPTQMRPMPSLPCVEQLELLIACYVAKRTKDNLSNPNQITGSKCKYRKE